MLGSWCCSPRGGTRTRPRNPRARIDGHSASAHPHHPGLRHVRAAGGAAILSRGQPRSLRAEPAARRDRLAPTGMVSASLGARDRGRYLFAMVGGAGTALTVAVQETQNRRYEVTYRTQASDTNHGRGPPAYSPIPSKAAPGRERLADPDRDRRSSPSSRRTRSDGSSRRAA